MRALFLVFFLVFPLTAIGDTLPITNSESPDGKYYLTIVPEPPGQGAAVGTAQIRLKKTDQVIGTIDYEGFGEQPDSNCYLSVKWNKDDTAFAVSWEVTRGYTECAVYANDHGAWKALALPNYVPQMLKREGIARGDGKGYENPLAWLPDNLLKIQIYERVCPYDYWAFLHLTREDGKLSMHLKNLMRKPPE